MDVLVGDVVHEELGIQENVHVLENTKKDMAILHDDMENEQLAVQNLDEVQSNVQVDKVV